MKEHPKSHSAHKKAHKKWVKSLPKSKMVYPEKIEKQLQYAFWRAFTPVHPFFRELAMPMRKLRGRSKRQHYLLGVLVEGRTLQQLVEHLQSVGYRRHHVAWRDPQEFLSMRLVENFDWQYHIRIFTDGEVRGHYELTPEAYPYKHLKKKHQEERREVFLKHLAGWIEPQEQKKEPRVRAVQS